MWITGLSILFASGVVFADIALPNTFTAGTPIKSADMNANFGAMNAGKQDKLVAFTHVAAAANITGNYSVIDNAAVNGKADAVLIVTANKSPPGGPTVFYAGSVSVQYDATGGKWSILHDIGPGQPIVAGEAWNVLVLKR
jgi:hypothetical protein